VASSGLVTSCTEGTAHCSRLTYKEATVAKMGQTENSQSKQKCVTLYI